MTSLSVPEASSKRRHYSPEFKSRIIEACQQPAASVAAVALAHGINANLVHKWIRKARQEPKGSGAPAFVPFPVIPVHRPTEHRSSDRIRIEIPRGQKTVVVEWPLSDSATCQSLLRELLR
jgi:transposase